MVETKKWSIDLEFNIPLFKAKLRFERKTKETKPKRKAEPRKK